MKNKNISNQTGNQNTQFNKNKPSPEIRDNLDSRKNEEQERKGDDITHNQKTHHDNLKKQKIRKNNP
jgi:hypothetical protein